MDGSIPPGFEEVVAALPDYDGVCAIVAEWMTACLGVEATAERVAEAHGGRATVDLCVFFWSAMDWKQGTRSMFDPETLRLRSLRPIPPKAPAPSAVSTAVAVAAGKWGPN